MRPRVTNWLTTVPLVLLVSLALCLVRHAAQAEGTGGESEKLASAVFAGGCFWCVESDLEKAPGVKEVVSGYSGGRSKSPNYENYAAGGHREVVLVTYDPKEVSYAGLVEYFIKHIDPTDRRGQFNDRGLQYSPAIYYADEQQRQAAERVLAALDEMNVYGRKKIGVPLESRSTFWPAEDYHQDYHQKNPLKYRVFRLASGRDAFVIQAWGNRATTLELEEAYPEGADLPVETAGAASEKSWLTFRKPASAELRRKLTPFQFQVTQQDGTEPAFRNEYWNHKGDGIYVDVVSGAPLFASTAKYDSGTGWPSFVEPITPDAVTFKIDRKLFYSRTEVRSRYGDSHLGHVFDDGPRQRGGKRYCINSAALRFVPKEAMRKEGYGDFLKFLEPAH